MIKPNAFILDVGCGGGKIIQELAYVSSSGKICGIDYSKEMVQLAQKINKTFLAYAIIDHITSHYPCIKN